MSRPQKSLLVLLFSIGGIRKKVSPSSFNLSSVPPQGRFSISCWTFKIKQEVGAYRSPLGPLFHREPSL